MFQETVWVTRTPNEDQEVTSAICRKTREIFSSRRPAFDIGQRVFMKV
jgi:hypothetical protein